MRLVKVTKTKDVYEIKARISYKILGMQILSREKLFYKREAEEQWKRPDGSSTVSGEKKEKLDKWLRDHKRFIERS